MIIDEFEKMMNDFLTGKAKVLTDDDIVKAVRKLSKNNKPKRWMKVKINPNGQYWSKQFSTRLEERKSKWRKIKPSFIGNL